MSGKTIGLAIVFLISSLPASGSEPSFRLEPVSFAEFQEQVSAPSDKILVVDLWATWCLPCRERFPIIHDLENSYQGQGIEFITLSFDDSRDPEALERARQFLQDQQADYRHFIMKDPMALVFHHLKLEVLPAVLVYDRSRRQMTRVLANVPTEQLRARIADEIDRRLFAEENAK